MKEWFIMKLEKTKISVLDHGYVRLVSYMQPLDVDETWTGDLEVIRNARVSYDADWRTGEDSSKDAGLINYLYKNKHTSPFEAMTFTFEIKLPLSIARQFQRHRTFAYNEVSARYTVLPEEIYVPQPEMLGTQSTSNKQMRDLKFEPSKADEGTVLMMQNLAREAYGHYKLLISMGVPREIARGVLPLHTYTRFFCTVNLHNLMHFTRLRDHEHAQHEIQVYAKAMKELASQICPLSFAAFDRYQHTYIDTVTDLAKYEEMQQKLECSDCDPPDTNFLKRLFAVFKK